MEKTLVSTTQTPAPHPLPASIPRKPLPDTTTVATTTTHPSKPDIHNPTRPPLPPKRRQLTQLKTRWHKLRKRTRTLLVAGTLTLLTLIIALPAALTHKSRFGNLPLPTSHGGPYTGDLTYYDPGLGACGLTSSSADAIVAVSHLLFDAVATGNPNANPLCGLMIRARRGGRSVDLKVVDRCTGCQSQDLDVTESVFGGLADVALGRVSVEWAWLQDAPAVGL